MKQEENNLKDTFEKELEKIKRETVLSPEFKRKKTILWGIRTIFAVILCVIFWEHNWIRWIAIAYIPLNLFSLLAIYGGKAILNKKIARTKTKIDAIEELLEETKNE